MVVADKPVADKPAGSRKLTVNVNAETSAALREIARRNSVSETDVIRQAVKIYKILDEERLSGGKLQIARGESVREILVIT